jgi:uncharacterized ferritin-like protein (DUF455 family)
VSAPAEGTVERWAWDYVLATDLAHKLEPPPPPEAWEPAPASRRVEAPGRPPELDVVQRAEKKRGLGTPRGRAQALHAFFHHELQAAELMAWAVLAYADAPREFREGLVRILLDETRHMRMYRARIEALGFHVGDFAVRDWFWTRIPTCSEPASFVAVMGLGLESANLDHSASFAARFREAGDEEGARVQELVGLEEIAHARFGARWFEHFAGTLEFDAWRRALPAPLSPMLMRGRPLQREMRRRAGQSERFLDELDAWIPEALPPSTPSTPDDVPGS